LSSYKKGGSLKTNKTFTQISENARTVLLCQRSNVTGVCFMAKRTMNEIMMAIFQVLKQDNKISENEYARLVELLRKGA